MIGDSTSAGASRARGVDHPDPPGAHTPRPFHARRAESVRALIEPRIRAVVTEQLAVAPGELLPETSSMDGLAANSLDLVETALAVERAFGVVLAGRSLEGMRTYDELVEAVVEAIDAVDRAAGPPVAAPEVHARIVPDQRSASWCIERIGRLTAYTARVIVEDALNAGRGARLEINVPCETDCAQFAAVHACFAGLAARGIEVSIVRQPAGSAPAGRIS